LATFVSQADLEKDREILIGTVRGLLTPLSDVTRFQWLYISNQYGVARSWYVIDSGSNDVIGMAAAFRRDFFVGEREVTAWVLGDFCLDPQYRSLGPALQLQRACLSVLENSQGGFCYDFPSASMVAVYKRLGFSVAGEMLRLAKPLRVDRKVKEMIKNRAAQRVVASVGNTLLKIASPRARANEALEISIQHGPCGEDFTALAEKQRGKFSFCLQRSAAYLNWRYVSNPLALHEIITARREGCLVGYVVWTHGGEDASIVDLFGEEDREMVWHLIAEVTALALKRGMMTLSVSMNEAHPWRSLFSEMGFRPRDSAPIMIIPAKTFAHKIDPQLSGWYLMQGDRDS
jgi:GNAT superfamily N-acetyltransferase